MQIAAYQLLIAYFTGITGVSTPGLTSLRKCNKYYNVGVPETDFTLLTKQALNNISRDEWYYVWRKPEYGGGIGGVNAEPQQLPFMAALGYDNGDQKEFVCGGTLISEEFVLTAAHCIHSRSWGKVKYIRLGDLNLTSSTDDIGVQEFQLKEAYVHPDYKYPIKYHDIALIKLNAPARFTEYVSPACLEPNRESLRDKYFRAAGWGRLGYGEDSSEHLQIVFIRHYPDIKCQEAYSSDYTIPEGVKPEYQICAGNDTYTVDTCEGDSGGPLTYVRPFKSKFVDMIVGITSFGKPCGIGKIPAVYTRVSYYTDWIEKIIWPNESIAFDRDRIYFPDD